MKLKPLGILPAIGLLGWFIATTYLDRAQNRRLAALERATVTITNVLAPRVYYPTYGNGQGAGDVQINGMQPTNITAPLSIPSAPNSR